MRNILGVATWLATTLAAQAWVYDLPADFVTSADVDGNGLADAVIVNKANGTYRIGYHFPATELIWSGEWESGVSNINAIALGHSVVSNRLALMVASPQIEGVMVLDIQNNGLNPKGGFLPAKGAPVRSVTALPFYGLPARPFDDVLMADLASWTYSYAYGDFNFTNLSAVLTNTIKQLQTFQFDSKDSQVALALTTSGSNQSINAFAIVTNAAGITNRQVLFNPVGLSGTNNYFLATMTNGPAAPAILHYRPGQAGYTNVTVVRDDELIYQTVTSRVFNLPAPVHRLFDAGLINGTNMLVVIYEDGKADIRRYSSTGSALQSGIIASENKNLLAALPLGANRLVFLSGEAGLIAGFEEHVWSGNKFELFKTGNFGPVLLPNRGRINVVVYDHDPFLAEAARISTFSTGAWTRSISGESLPGSVNVGVAADGGTNAGLSASSIVTLGPAADSANFGLVNRYRDDVSFSFADSASGGIALDVAASPPPGRNSSAVQVTLQAIPDGAVVYYRTATNQNWGVYQQPFWLFASTTVEAYAQQYGFRTGTKSFNYSFSTAPDEQDADNDGVPDYVEAANGLDPENSGVDADGDGLSDLDELFHGTDPRVYTTNDLGHINLSNTYDLNAVVYAVNITTNYQHYASYRSNRYGPASGTLTTVHKLGGGVLAERPLIDYGGVSVANLDIPMQEVLPVNLISTPNVYLVTNAATTFTGSELMGFYRQPDFDVGVAYTNGGGDYRAEASNWIATAQSSLSTGVTYSTARYLEVSDALAAALLEHKIADILNQRDNLIGRPVTLFPHRAIDAARFAPTQGDLLNLAEAADEVPAYSVLGLFTNVEAAVDARVGAMSNLVDLAIQIWGIHAEHGSVSNGIIRLPLDVLRDFLSGGALDNSYTNFISLNAAAISNAFTAGQSLLDGLPSRTTVTLAMTVTSNSYRRAGLVFVNIGGEPYLLMEDARTPLSTALSVRLPVGTQINVTGYDDLGEEPGIGTRFEVVSMEITSFPVDGPSGPIPGTAPIGELVIADGRVILRWSSESNLVYGIERSTNLVQGFTPLATGIPATPPLNTYTADLQAAGSEFWSISDE